MDRPFVRLDSVLMAQLREVKRLTSLPIQTLLDKAVAKYIDEDIPPILQGWGVSKKEIDQISQMRYLKEPKKAKRLPDAKKALA